MEIVTEEIMFNLWFNHLQRRVLEEDEEEKNKKYEEIFSYFLPLFLFHFSLNLIFSKNSW